jgi:hypothetical protein
MSSKHAKVPTPCKSKLTRSSNFRKSCSNPRAMPTGKSPYKNQIHHILCEHAILDIQPAGDTGGKKLKYIKACLCSLGWDINESGNLIGLPLKSVYRNTQGKTPQNFCCHNVDHNINEGYTTECKKWLHRQVWNQLDEKDGHEVTSAMIMQGLQDCIENFTGLLESRALRPGGEGTQYAYENRFTLDEWYAAFSMAEFPTERSPGGRGNSKLLARIS